MVRKPSRESFIFTITIIKVMIKNIFIVLLFFTFSIYAQKYQDLSLRKIKKNYFLFNNINDIYYFKHLPENEFVKHTNSFISIIISSNQPTQKSYIFFPNVSVLNLTEFTEISNFKNGFSDIIRIVDTNNIQAIFIENASYYKDLQLNHYGLEVHSGLVLNLIKSSVCYSILAVKSKHLKLFL